MGRGKYFLSFVEECIMNPLYQDYIGGRIEVYEKGEPFATKEIRFFTRSVNKFRDLRNEWDMKHVTVDGLKILEDEISERYCKVPKRITALKTIPK